MSVQESRTSQTPRQPFEGTAQAADSADLRVWLLLDDRPGHVTQVVGLADALGWPYETKALRFTWLNRLSNRLLGASLLSLNLKKSAALTPPWPDLVITMGRRTAPIARWIKRQSGGRCRLVQLGRKGANVASVFDLAVTCRHFQLPDHPNRLEVLLPPTQVTADRLKAAAARWPDLYGTADRPRVALLVGGTTAHHRLPAAIAAKMAAESQALADSLGGSLTCITSRRSGKAVEQALEQAAPSASMHFWRADQTENPYLGYLAGADVLIVTGESESMLAEAAAAAKPLYIYPVPARPVSWRTRMAHRVLSASRSGVGLTAAVCTRLIAGGWVVPPRNLGLMHRGMIEAGIASNFGDNDRLRVPPPQSGQAELTERVHQLLDRN